MDDYASDSLFSDQEEEAGSVKDLTENGPSSVDGTQSLDAESESSSTVTPIRPPSGTSRQVRKRRQRLSDGDDSEESSTEKEPSLKEINDLLKHLVNKVEKNSKTLTELQNIHFSRFAMLISYSIIEVFYTMLSIHYILVKLLLAQLQKVHLNEEKLRYLQESE